MSFMYILVILVIFAEFCQLQETVNMLVEGVAQLVRAERLMELGTSAAEAETTSILVPVPVLFSRLYQFYKHACARTHTHK